MTHLKELISVIVCTYNQQDTIGRTLDSILSQECHLPFEIIIGEDCSTDNTLAICKQYEQKHPDVIRVIANPSNKGFVQNYFDCLRACKGKYIADCAGDDFWIDNKKLEDESIILENDQSIGIVHTDWLRYNEDTQELSSPGKAQNHKPKVDGKSLLAAILMPDSRPAIHLCTSLFRNDWIRKAMQQYPQFFDPQSYLCEDVQIAFFLAHMGNVAWIDKATLAYSCGKHTISNPNSEEKQFHFWANATKLSYNLAQSFNLKDKQLDIFFQARIHKLMMHAFRSGKPSLKIKAMEMQQEMNIEDNRQIRICKILLFPGIWQMMRHIRSIIKSIKTQN